MYKKKIRPYIRLLLTPKHQTKTTVVIVMLMLFALYINGVIVQSSMFMGTLFETSEETMTLGLKSILYGIKEPFRAAVIFFVLVIISLFLYIRKKGVDLTEYDYKLSSKGDHGTARLLTDSEKSEHLRLSTIGETKQPILGMTKDRELVYSYDPENMPGWDPNNFEARNRIDFVSNKNKVIIASSGKRKTRGVVEPDCLQAILRGESIIVTDPKGEIFSRVAPVAQAYGYDVRLLNFKEPEHSDSCNYLSIIYEGGDKTITAQSLARTIIDNTVDGKKDEWDQVAEFLMVAALLYYTAEDDFNPEIINMPEINEFIKQPMAELFQAFDDLDDDHPAKISANAFFGASDNYKANAQFALIKRLQIFDSNAIRNISVGSDVDFSAPGKKKCAYFIAVPDSESHMDFLAAMFFSCSFISLTRFADARTDGRTSEALPVAVNFILDEFPNIATISDFTKKIATVRSRNMSITIAFQDLGQLMKTYKDYQYASILTNCQIKIFLGGDEILETLPYIRSLMGDATTDTEQFRVPHGGPLNEALKDARVRGVFTGTQVGMSTGQRYVMTDDELRRMSNDDQLVFVGNLHPAIMKKFDRSFHPLNELYGTLLTSEYIPLWKKREDDYFEAIKKQKKPMSKPIGSVVKNKTDNRGIDREYSQFQNEKRDSGEAKHTSQGLQDQGEEFIRFNPSNNKTKGGVNSKKTKTEIKEDSHKVNKSHKVKPQRIKIPKYFENDEDEEDAFLNEKEELEERKQPIKSLKDF